MAKVKYYYNSEKLAYQKIETKKRKKIGYFLLFITAAALFGFLCFVLFLNIPFLQTPNDKSNNRTIENLLWNYKVLNKRVVQMEEALQSIEKRDENIYRTLFNEGYQRKNAIQRSKNYINWDNPEAVVRMTQENIDSITNKIIKQTISLDEIVKFAKNKEKLMSAIPAIQPVRNEDLTRMASGFGYRNDPFTKIRKFHKGMDFSAKTGTPIHATGDGRVVRADNSMSGYGNHILIQHGFGYQTLYAHLSKYKVKSGQHVKRGDVIGYVGSTGRSEAAHLHYEVYQNSKVVNPLNFYYASISAKEYELLTIQAEQENQSLD
ncbi:MAG: peptidoglycan DD-metalloendopeptidase family protein [Flavobacterium sp.]|nr:peptidoglycan DD-metalloendopeptidase family protein [Candidatus Neoflavobacterium equi]